MSKDLDILSSDKNFAQPLAKSANLAILEGSDGLIICLLTLFIPCLVFVVLLANDNDSFSNNSVRF